MDLAAQTDEEIDAVLRHMLNSGTALKDLPRTQYARRQLVKYYQSLTSAWYARLRS